MTDKTVKVWPMGDQSAPGGATSTTPAADGSYSVSGDTAAVLCESHGFSTTNPATRRGWGASGTKTAAELRADAKAASDAADAAETAEKAAAKAKAHAEK